MEETKFELKFPFEPPWEDLRMQGTAVNGTKWFVFGSRLATDPEERAAIDREIGEIWARSERRKFMERMNTEEDSGNA